MGKVLEKLSSGYRINRAADDAAGLGISEKMRAQIRGNSQAIRNAQDGISMIQTAEGAMDEVHGILQRMRELGVQAANDTYDAAARTSIGTELVQLRSEIDRIANATQFNGQRSISFNDIRATAATGLDLNTVVGTVDWTSSATIVASNTAAQAFINQIDAAVTTLNTRRSDLGAAQNRLEHTVNSLGASVENLTASESRIRDADVAELSTKLVSNQILQQAGTAVLAQANQASQSALSLLR